MDGYLSGIVSKCAEAGLSVADAVKVAAELAKDGLPKSDTTDYAIRTDKAGNRLSTPMVDGQGRPWMRSGATYGPDTFPKQKAEVKRQPVAYTPYRKPAAKPVSAQPAAGGSRNVVMPGVRHPVVGKDGYTTDHGWWPEPWRAEWPSIQPPTMDYSKLGLNLGYYGK